MKEACHLNKALSSFIRREKFPDKGLSSTVARTRIPVSVHLRDEIYIAVKSRHIQQEYIIYEQNEPHTSCNIIMSSKPYRVGQWIPSDQKVLDKWL